MAEDAEPDTAPGGARRDALERLVATRTTGLDANARRLARVFAAGSGRVRGPFIYLPMKLELMDPD